MIKNEFFEKNRYIFIQNLVPLDLCRIVTKYSLMKEENEFSAESKEEAQVENAHSVYSDTLMETLLYFLRPHVEQNTGIKLCPTYSYYRVYRPGMKLDRHRDRESCEISATVCFGYEYLRKNKEYKWGMYVEPNILITQKPGDAIIYKGCEIDHWRDVFDAGLGSYQVQAFFHYINVDGPYFPKFSYDSRPSLGYRNNRSNMYK